MTSYCGADCENCGYGKQNGCKGCKACGASPFGKQCFIAKYKAFGETQYKPFEEKLIGEINSLCVEGMPEIHELFPLNGAYVNIAYPTPGGEYVKLLDDRDIYLGNQVESLFSDGEAVRCFGIVAGLDFIIVSEYGANCKDPELIVYKKR